MTTPARAVAPAPVSAAAEWWKTAVVYQIYLNLIIMQLQGLDRAWRDFNHIAHPGGSINIFIPD